MSDKASTMRVAVQARLKYCIYFLLPTVYLDKTGTLDTTPTTNRAPIQRLLYMLCFLLSMTHDHSQPHTHTQNDG
jgi:hypothetical protein